MKSQLLQLLQHQKGVSTDIHYPPDILVLAKSGFIWNDVGPENSGPQESGKIDPSIYIFPTQTVKPRKGDLHADGSPKPNCDVHPRRGSLRNVFGTAAEDDPTPGGGTSPWLCSSGVREVLRICHIYVYR